MMRLAIALVLTGSILAACSAEKHPTEDQLKAGLETLWPQVISVQSLTVKYSPMKLVSGTSLPDGSLQATCKVVAKLNQDLYVKSNEMGQRMAEPEAIRDLMRRAEIARGQGFELSRYLGAQAWQQADKNLYDDALNTLIFYPSKAILYLRSPAGQVVQFDASIGAVPQIDSWQLAVLDEGGWNRLQPTLGLPSSFYESDAVRFNSPEGASYLAGYRSAVERYERTRRQIIEQYEKRLIAVVDRCRGLLKANAVLSGTLTTLSTSEKIRGKFLSGKEDDGTLSIAKETDSDENAAIFYVRLADIPSSESGPAVVSAVNQTIILIPKRGGYLGEIPTVGGPPYLGIDGNKLSGYVGIKILRLDIN
jgi:hypothetical protein